MVAVAKPKIAAGIRGGTADKEDHHSNRDLLDDGVAQTTSKVCRLSNRYVTSVSGEGYAGYWWDLERASALHWVHPVRHFSAYMKCSIRGMGESMGIIYFV